MGVPSVALQSNTERYAVKHLCYSVTMPLKKKPTPSSATTVRWSPEDHALIEALRKKSGTRTVSDLVRRGLRALAEKEGIR